MDGNTSAKRKDKVYYVSSHQFSKLFFALTLLGVGCYCVVFIAKIESLSVTIDKLDLRGRWASSSLRWRDPDWKKTEDVRLMERLESSNKTKVILAWHKPRWLGGLPKIWYHKCGNCAFTFDRKRINDTATGAVLFYFTGIKDTDMPQESHRNPNQLHIFWTIEPPPHVRLSPNCLKVDYHFNATMSYRRTSDFYSHYNYGGADEVIKLNLSGSDILNMKTKGGLSLISNCRNAPGPRVRLRMIRKIQSLGFPLDGFGKCFRSNESLRKGEKDFKQRIRQYKFYFSFENSYHCRDYITEKVFTNALQNAVAIPVVWGALREDYETFLPTGSFIFAEDFDSIEKLVEYLQYLMKNDTAYLEYFKWHRTEKLKPEGPVGGAGYGFCQICRALHGINIDDRHHPNYDPMQPPRPSFTDEIAKRNATSIRSFVFDEETKDCNALHEKNWKFYQDWKLGDSL